MNRVLVWPSELEADNRITLRDRRARHLLRVLGVEPRREVRIGLVDGPRGMGTVETCGGHEVVLRCTFDDEPHPPFPSISLMLAMPRPKVMKRLWAPLASVGVRRIVLTNAEKVERAYFDTHWVDPEHYTPLLLEGLEQSGDTLLPRVDIRRRLKPFVEDELDGEFPDTLRLLAHAGDGTLPSAIGPAPAGGCLLAIGPEGGWTDYERALLARHRFGQISLGWRTLRTDTACVALVAGLQGVVIG